MESMPDIDTVLHAIHALYDNPDAAGKEQASTWLGQLQSSVFAWKVSDQLLLKKSDVESCYFAAQTMRTKIQFSFHELPEEAHQSLRDSLMSHISNLGDEANVIIVTQLCLALADLALQIATWKAVPKALIERFAGDPKNLPALLEVLTVLPEEVNSRSLRLGENRRRDITDDLTSNFPYVFQFLNVCGENMALSERHLCKVFKCLGSWLSLSYINSDSVANSKLLLSIFHSLVKVETPSFLHEAATDCICSALLLIDDMERHISLAKSLIHGVFSLPDAYQLSIVNEENDKSVNYCRIFTELAESLLDTIVASPKGDVSYLRTLDLLLTCVDNPDYDVAEITFNFWYRLSEALYQGNSDELSSLFRPYIERLISALCRHCCLEPDKEGIPEEGDDFSEFRTKVSELIKDVVFIVGSKNCFHQMFENLKNQFGTSSWENSEAALYIMTAVAKNVLPEENEVVPQVVDALLNLNHPDSKQMHVAVQYTGTQLLGELCEWIDSHPGYLEPVLNFLLKCLQDGNLATVAATALQNICSACRDHMGTHFSGLLQIVQVLDSLSISHEAAVGLLKGTALILAKMPLEKVTDGMKQLCLIQVTPLVKILNEGQPVCVGGKSDPAIWLDRLAAIFRHTNPIVHNGQVHPCKAVVQDVWPVLSETCNKYQSDIRIIERVCRCIRFAIRCIGKQSAALLQPLVQQIVELYQTHQHSCFLYLGSILVDEYGNEPGCIRGLVDMLNAFCTPTFRLLDRHNGLRNHPDTVDDLFRLCARFIQRSPIAFLESDMLGLIINCGLAACTLEHKDANTSVMKFFHDFVKCARVNQESEDHDIRHGIIVRLLDEHGQSLVNNLIQAPLFCLPTYMIPDVAEVIMELMLLDRPNLCRWLETTLNNLPTQRSGGVVTATNKQLTDFHKNVTRAETSKSVSMALRDFSRLYR